VTFLPMIRIGLPQQSSDDSDFSDGGEGDSDYDEDDDSNGE
jgi:hypothetical protein